MMVAKKFWLAAAIVLVVPLAMWVVMLPAPPAPPPDPPPAPPPPEPGEPPPELDAVTDRTMLTQSGDITSMLLDLQRQIGLLPTKDDLDDYLQRVTDRIDLRVAKAENRMLRYIIGTGIAVAGVIVTAGYFRRRNDAT